MSNSMDKYNELFDMKNVEMTIEDGAMIIKPSDAGIVMLSMLELNNKEMDTMSDIIDELRELYEKNLDDLAKVRNYLEEIVERLNTSESLNNTGVNQLKEDILSFLYPVYGVDADGVEHKLEERPENV